VRRLVGIFLIASILAGCSERSSLFIENGSSRTVIVRVFFHDFGESFGYRVPAGVRAWGWAPLEGRVTGPIAIYDESCNIIWHAEIRPDGGRLTVDEAGGFRLTAPQSELAEPTSALLDYTDRCADSSNPRR
jgi:hypothetical protein